MTRTGKREVRELQKQLQQKWVGTEEKMGDREQGGKLF